MEVERIEKSLLHTKKTLREVCWELDEDMPSKEDLLISQCTHCSIWNKNYKLVEDLDGNNICRFCVDLIGM